MEKSVRHHLNLMIKLNIVNNGQTDIMWPHLLPVTGIINDCQHSFTWSQGRASVSPKTDGIILEKAFENLSWCWCGHT